MELMINPQPLPDLPVRVRPGTMDDLSFIDGLQRMHTKQVGWMPTKQFEGKIAAGHVLVAWASRTCTEDTCGTPVPRSEERVGYLIGNDQYFKRDDVGIIYQINVAPVAQRGLIGATLLKAQFERSAWGCRLYCCWCAQDIAANQFWQAMGFVPLAFRAGSEKRSRVHIFWQKRIRAGDTQTPWWFPSKTDGGAMREDRIVLPIPPGVKWSDEMPRIVPKDGGQGALPPVKRAAGRKMQPEGPKPPGGGTQFGPPPDKVVAVPPKAEAPAEKPKRERKPKVKADPQMVSAARELRDRWLEAVNRGEFVALPEAKYEVAREIEAPKTPTLPSPGVPGEGSQITLLPAA